MNQDETTNKLMQILDLLGKDNFQDKLTDLLGSSVPQNERTSKKELDLNPESLLRAKKVFEAFQNSNDPRVNLLHSIKPFLNSNRQKKIGNCIKIIQMANLTKLMSDENGLLKGD